MSSETHDIGPAEVNTQKIALIGVGGAVATFFLIVLTQFFFYFVRNKIDANKGLSDPVKEANRRTADQQGKLVGDGKWVDQKGGIAAVPIDVAMELAVAGKRAMAAAAAPAPMPPAPKVDAGPMPIPKADAAIPMPIPKAEAKK